MSRVSVTYILPRDQEEFDTHMDGQSWKNVAWEFSNYLRSQYKYNDALTGEQSECYDNARQKLHELINEEGLQL
jgi:hypothetical protein